MTVLDIQALTTVLDIQAPTMVSEIPELTMLAPMVVTEVMTLLVMDVLAMAVVEGIGRLTASMCRGRSGPILC